VNLLKSGLFVLLGTYALFFSSAFAEFNTQPYQAFSGQCSVRPELYDPEVMAHTMANPQKLKEFMAVISQPETTLIMMSCASNPDQWSAWMTKISDPNKMMKTMMVFMNPQFYASWMTALMSPQFYQSM
jgi:hypothetical protein